MSNAPPPPNRRASCAMPPRQRVILWFRNDLRLHDNPLFHHPLAHRSARHEVVCAYCADPAVLSGRLRQTGLPKVGARRSRFLRESVQELRGSLREIGGDLLVAPEAPQAFLTRLASHPGAAGGDAARAASAVAVVVAQGVTAEEQAEEARVEAALAALPVPARLHRVWGLTLYHIDDLPYRDVRREFPMVFAPFGRAVRGNFRAADAAAVAAAQRGEQGVPVRPELDPPKALPRPPAGLQALSAEDVEGCWPPVAASNAAVYGGPCPDGVDAWWEATFVGGEGPGLRRLAEFVTADLGRYKDTRNGLTGLRFSSKLSPWVAAGCVSPRRVARAVRDWELTRCHGRPSPSSAHYVSEYGWRDFLIFLALKCGASLFRLEGPGGVALPWVRDAALARRLFTGTVGVPLIDAAVREMWVSGFMSNRARQFVASYVVLELRLDWRVGAELFESGLVDYDVCANWGNWMRAAGVSGQGFGNGGSRWFDLAEERDRFDPEGAYVRLWLPELRGVPARWVHCPWAMGPGAERPAGLRDYPAPPDTPSRRTLEGSATAKEVAPEWYASTRGGKREQAPRAPGDGAPRGPAPAGPGPEAKGRARGPAKKGRVQHQDNIKTKRAREAANRNFEMSWGLQE